MFSYLGGEPASTFFPASSSLPGCGPPLKYSSGQPGGTGLDGKDFEKGSKMVQKGAFLGLFFLLFHFQNVAEKFQPGWKEHTFRNSPPSTAVRRLVLSRPPRPLSAVDMQRYASLPVRDCSNEWLNVVARVGWLERVGALEFFRPTCALRHKFAPLIIPPQGVFFLCCSV